MTVRKKRSKKDSRKTKVARKVKSVPVRKVKLPAKGIVRVVVPPGVSAFDIAPLPKKKSWWDFS